MQVPRAGGGHHNTLPLFAPLPFLEQPPPQLHKLHRDPIQQVHAVSGAVTLTTWPMHAL